jgi:hypothetical protein
MSARGMARIGALVVTAWSAAASAQHAPVDAPWRVAFEVGGRWHHDRGLDAFGATRSPPITGLTVARDLLRNAGRLSLSVDVNWNAEGFEGQLREAFKTRLTTHTLRARAFWWMEPYARLGAGALYSDINLEPESGTSQGGALTGDAWTFAATGGLGVLVTTAPFLGRVRFAAAIEGGYQLALSQELRVHPATLVSDAAQADRLPVADTALGTLNQSGGYLRALIGLRF